MDLDPVEQRYLITAAADSTIEAFDALVSPAAADDAAAVAAALSTAAAAAQDRLVFQHQHQPLGARCRLWLQLGTCIGVAAGWHLLGTSLKTTHASKYAAANLQSGVSHQHAPRHHAYSALGWCGRRLADNLARGAMHQACQLWTSCSCSLSRHAGGCAVQCADDGGGHQPVELQPLFTVKRGSSAAHRYQVRAMLLRLLTGRRRCYFHVVGLFKGLRMTGVDDWAAIQQRCRSAASRRMRPDAVQQL